ncbi:MAG: hypothetical protein NTW62_01615 [Candidatus Nomurabacteria bacterium]|nr:hypothetical protein [Candidatus Nomurabacteria bacterium]
MKIIQILVVVTGLLPYLLISIGIIKGTVKQSFATWLLWLLLDFVMLAGILKQNGNILLYSVFTFGTLIVTLLLVFKKQFSWGKFESCVSLLVAICAWIYLSNDNAYVTTFSTVIALNIAAIPQIIDTLKRPHLTSTTANFLFATSSLLSISIAEKWTMKDLLPQINAMVFCSLIAVLSMRKVDLFKKRILWEILVPTHFNSHEKIEISHHKEWDLFVEQITKGLTIESPTRGIWLDENNNKYEERMIPVKISGSKKQMLKIADFTARHYKQKAISFYKISEEMYIINYDIHLKPS